MRKTLAMRFLEGKGVSYEAYTYPSDERSAEVVAKHIGVSPAQVFKTLVVVRDYGKPLLVMIPANRQLDLKKTAKALGEKKVKLASHAEAEEMTRLQVGGISPLALINRSFDVVVDQSAASLDSLYMSAGEKGINLRVAMNDLMRLTRARTLDVTSEDEPED